jgi:hypothetical protein
MKSFSNTPTLRYSINPSLFPLRLRAFALKNRWCKTNIQAPPNLRRPSRLKPAERCNSLLSAGFVPVDTEFDSGVG